jgi:BolA protein
MGIYNDRIQRKLDAAFQPSRLEIVDDSARHSGHAGAHRDGGGETHFHVMMESGVFAGKTRVQRQRLVHEVLAEELSERVHALSLSLKAPGER